MNKDFLKWHNQKQDLHENGPRTFYKQREVWWCRVGLNIGFEQDGKGEEFARPVLIIKGFSKEVFWGLPITTSPKSGPYYLNLDLGDETARKAVISQIRLMDAKRLIGKIATLNKDDFVNIKKAII
ncbi:MAG: type II toxin-antitoxin system PemK/MazF family toxin [Patescibacteria group bacterium]